MLGWRDHFESSYEVKDDDPLSNLDLFIYIQLKKELVLK